MNLQASIGLDFGTASVRALVVAIDGRELGAAGRDYSRGVITGTLPGEDRPLPPLFALQHPLDWIDSAAAAVREALARAGPVDLAGIGVDFTSCTMLPALTDGTPLCLLERFRNEPHAWPKLWKHHGAIPQAERMTAIARQRGESFLKRYGGVIGEEWLFPKILEAIEHAPAVAEAAGVWLEAGDWFVWQLTGGPAAALPRSTCQAGYKALWNEQDGYPPAEYLAAVHPGLAEAAARRMPGRLVAPGHPAGRLTVEMAERLGLPAGLPVSAAIIDAHAGVAGSGASLPGTLVMVMGTSSCHMLNSDVLRDIPGVAGVVRDGILPGYYGYETGQPAVGDAFDWLRRLTGQTDFAALSAAAAALPPGAGGVRCLDWFNGCRTPRMDGTLRGAFRGLSLHHGPAHLHRALMEATACGVRWIVDLMREAGVPVEHFIATGGLPRHDPFLVQLYADLLGEPVTVPAARQGPALGAAILGALAAGAFDSSASAIQAMAGAAPSATCHPDPSTRAAYDAIYDEYRIFTRNPGSR